MEEELSNTITDCLKLKDEINDITFIFIKDEKYGDTSETEYQISDISMFESYPSRQPIWDSQLRELNNSRKFDKIYKLISKLEFCPSISNISERYEQIFSREVEKNDVKIILNLRLQPNLFCKVDYLCEDGIMVIYKGYFEFDRIIKILNFIDDINAKQIIRDIIIDEILV